MSSYATYCEDHAADCARRARLATSPEWQSTVDVWGCAGLGLQSRHKGRLLRVGRMTQHFGKQRVGTQNLRRQRHHGWSPRHVRSDVRLLAKVQVLFGF